MLGFWKKKHTYESVIKNQTSVSKYVDGLLVLNDYYVSEFHRATINDIHKLDDDSLCRFISQRIISGDEYSSAFCEHAENPEIGKLRVPIMFFDTFIFIGMSFNDAIIYGILRPKIKITGLDAIDGMSANITITALLTAMRQVSSRESVSNIFARDADAIIRKLWAMKPA